MSNKTTQTVMQTIGNVASFLTQQVGIQIYFGASRPCTDGRNIFLPNIPENISQRSLVLMCCWIDHEAAHIVGKSDMAVAKMAADRGADVEHLTQAIEDLRVNRVMGSKWRGCNYNLTKGSHYMLELLFDQLRSRPASEQPEPHVLAGIELFRRFYGFQREDCDTLIPKWIADVVTECQPSILTAIGADTTTADAFRVAIEVAALLRQHKEEEKNREEGGGDGGHADGDGESEGKPETEQQEASGNGRGDECPSPDEAGGKSEGADGDGSQSQSQSDQASGGPPLAPEGPKSKSASSQTIRGAFDSLADELIKSIQDDVRDDIADVVGPNSEPGASGGARIAKFIHPRRGNKWFVRDALGSLVSDKVVARP